MTGLEHYRKAEEILLLLADVERGSSDEPSLLGEAQVHATLALAASFLTDPGAVAYALKEQLPEQAAAEPWQPPGGRRIRIRGDRRSGS